MPSTTRNNKMVSVVMRFDHNWSDRHKSFLQVYWNHETELIGDDFRNVSTGDGPNARIFKGAGFDHVWTISPTKVLDIRYGLSRFEEPTQPHSLGFDPKTLGFPTSYVAQLQRNTFPSISVLGIGSGGAGGYFDSTYHSLLLRASQVHSNMTFRYSADVMVLQQAGGSVQGAGSFGFSGV